MGVNLAEALELSPRQKAEIFFHPRDDKGNLIVSESSTEPATARLAQLLTLIEVGVVKATPEQLERLRAMADGGAT